MSLGIKLPPSSTDPPPSVHLRSSTQFQNQAFKGLFIPESPTNSYLRHQATSTSTDPPPPVHLRSCTQFQNQAFKETSNIEIYLAYLSFQSFPIPLKKK
ncbi:hypothetical protein V6Z11_D05G122100 [Gossypium hirsutum]